MLPAQGNALVVTHNLLDKRLLGPWGFVPGGPFTVLFRIAVLDPAFRDSPVFKLVFYQ